MFFNLTDTYETCEECSCDNSTAKNGNPLICKNCKPWSTKFVLVRFPKREPKRDSDFRMEYGNRRTATRKECNDMFQLDPDINNDALSFKDPKHIWGKY